MSWAAINFIMLLSQGSDYDKCSQLKSRQLWYILCLIYDIYGWIKGMNGWTRGDRVVIERQRVMECERLIKSE